jgi:CBS domain-containing protein
MKRVIVQGLDPRTTRVSDVMTKEIWAADINDDHGVAMSIMSERRIRHLPILDQGTLAGFISLRDLLRLELEGKDHEIRSLTEYIHYVPPSAG